MNTVNTKERRVSSFNCYSQQPKKWDACNLDTPVLIIITLCVPPHPDEMLLTYKMGLKKPFQTTECLTSYFLCHFDIMPPTPLLFSLFFKRAINLLHWDRPLWVKKQTNSALGALGRLTYLYGKAKAENSDKEILTEQKASSMRK